MTFLFYINYGKFNLIDQRFPFINSNNANYYHWEEYICNWICEKGYYMYNCKYLEIQFWNIQFNISRMIRPTYVFTKNSQMTSIGVIFTSTCHTKQLNPWTNSSASCVMIYRQLSVYWGKMVPFEGYPSTHGHQTGLRKRSECKQIVQPLAVLNTIACCWSTNVANKWGWKVCLKIAYPYDVFGKSSHIYGFQSKAVN